MGRKIKILSLALAVVSLTATLTGCGGTASEGSSNQGSNLNGNFTYFLGTGDPTQYYDSYQKNPVMNYLLNYKTWGPNNDKLSIDFQTPATGEATAALSTMMGSGDYTDIIDTSYYKGQVGTVPDLYNNGIALDLTSYVKQYMPNYLKWFDDHPSYKKIATSKIDGEDKYLEIYMVNDTADPWGGFCYRRDWLVKYGTNPKTNAAFKGGYDADKNWTDDIIFPSGGSDPVYLSDWEWMLGIIKTAMTSEGISDGYAFQIPYGGFEPTGDVLSSFGTSYNFFLDPDHKYQFGGNSDNFRAYLQLMNDWYMKGYIDKKFAERTNDSFYQIDSTSVHQGKVGLWYGMTSSLCNLMDISEGKENNATNGYTNGIYVAGARLPINDKFGTSSMQNIDPFLFYRGGLVPVSIVITNKAKDKNLPALLSMLDYLYTDEGCLLNQNGLTKEQYELTKDPLYTANGLTEGSWWYCDEKGEKWVEGTSTGKKLRRFNPLLNGNDELQTCVINNRVIGKRLGAANNAWLPYKADYIKYRWGEWNKFETVSDLMTATVGSLTGDEAVSYSQSVAKINDFLFKNTPKLILGSMDVNSDTTWSGFCSGLNKYKPDVQVAVLQKAYDNL